MVRPHSPARSGDREGRDLLPGVRSIGDRDPGRELHPDNHPDAVSSQQHRAEISALRAMAQFHLPPSAGLSSKGRHRIAAPEPAGEADASARDGGH